MSYLRTQIWNEARRRFDWHVLPNYEEYQRRNLLHAGSIGANACLRGIKERLADQKRIPKWLLEELDKIAERIEPIPADLAQWRSLVGYVPEVSENAE